MENCLLIAECCQNHNGDRRVLQEMIHAAAENGADYVKIQTMHSEELSFRERFEEGIKDENGNILVIKRPYNIEKERLKKLDLTLETEAWFIQECKNFNVLPLTTAFTRVGAQRIRDLDYEAIKVASYDCRSFPFLKDLTEQWSTLFVSTGATFDHEIESAAQILCKSKFHFLHCVTIYPTPLNEVHLNRMKFLRKFTPLVGFSDHSSPSETGLLASKAAIALGASCVERHFSVLEKNQTKDGPVSITPKMLREIKDFSCLTAPEQMTVLREEYPHWEVVLGKEHRELSHAELLNRDYYAGRFVNKSKNKESFNWEE